MIEKYFHNKEGYNPFFIKQHWQVAQLNENFDNYLENINKVEKHEHTDEIFILIKGQAILFETEFIDNICKFNFINMEIGVTYNVPKNIWHNIVIQKNSQLIIVEKSNTHINDVIYKTLNIDEIYNLKLQIQKLK